MFLITAAVYFTGAIGFLILGSGEPQPWATQKNAEIKLKEFDLEENVPLKERVNLTKE